MGPFDAPTLGSFSAIASRTALLKACSGALGFRQPAPPPAVGCPGGRREAVEHYIHIFRVRPGSSKDQGAVNPKNLRYVVGDVFMLGFCAGRPVSKLHWSRKQTSDKLNGP
jgi:hypothetical protein